MKILVLDDDIERLKLFKEFIDLYRLETNNKILYEFTSDADECISKMKDEQFDIFFLDHDLGGLTHVNSVEENTGSEVSRWIVDNKDIVTGRVFIIHSFNPVGAKYMYDRLKTISEDVIYVPGIWSDYNKLSLILTGYYQKLEKELNG